MGASALECGGKQMLLFEEITMALILCVAAAAWVYFACKDS